MSITYNLMCRDCKEYLWVGQGHYIYTSQRHLKALEEFLYEHEEHSLCFTHSEHEDHTMDYKEFKDFCK